MKRKYNDDTLRDDRNEDTAMSAALEQRVTTALTADSVASADLAAILEEVQVAIGTTELKKSKTIDPLASPDADNAWEAVERAAFMRDRLRTLRPRLEQRLQEVRAEEYLIEWRTGYEAHKIEQDQLAAELTELYSPFAMKIADLFGRIQAFDAERSQLLQARPAGAPGYLLGPELVARRLEHFTRDAQSLLKEVKLPAFEPGQPQVWPPPRKLDPAVFASVPHNRHYSADWGSAAQERARATSKRNEREVAEATARAAQRGEWWAR